ncbi:MAG: glycosyltransferase [Prevotella sp.]|nr:glycosyltransferase [Prevotella sp.]
MKIFIVQSHLGGGGAERVGVMLANGFSLRGHDVTIATDLKAKQNYIPLSSVKIVNIVSSKKNVLIKWCYAIWNLRNICAESRPDVIIGIMQLSSFVSKVSTIGLGIPTIMMEHYYFESPNGLTSFEKFCKFYLNKVYPIVTVLTSADKILAEQSLKHIVIMPNPLALKPVVNKGVRSNVLLAIGRLDAWYYKGFDVLIKSFAKLLNGSKVAEPRSRFKSNDIAFKIREEGWKLQIAGTGSEESLNYLKQLCKENGIEDSVEFLGFRKDVEKLYQEASAFVLSSRYEAFGLVLIEAMSQGCACIACDYKGRQREIMSPTSTLPSWGGESSVESPSLGTRNMNPDARLSRFRSYDGERTQNIPVEACETGILCEPDNVNALADAMTKMITDDEYRESVRKNAIERSKYYSIENTMDRWEKLLGQVVNKK